MRLAGNESPQRYFDRRVLPHRDSDMRGLRIAGVEYRDRIAREIICKQVPVARVRRHIDFDLLDGHLPCVLNVDHVLVLTRLAHSSVELRFSGRGADSRRRL